MNGRLEQGQQARGSKDIDLNTFFEGGQKDIPLASPSSNQAFAKEALAKLQVLDRFAAETGSSEIIAPVKIIIGSVTQVATGDISRVNIEVLRQVRAMQDYASKTLNVWNNLTCYNEVEKMRAALRGVLSHNDLLNEILVRLIDYAAPTS